MMQMVVVPLCPISEVAEAVLVNILYGLLSGEDFDRYSADREQAPAVVAKKNANWAVVVASQEQEDLIDQTTTEILEVNPGVEILTVYTENLRDEELERAYAPVLPPKSVAAQIQARRICPPQVH